MHLVPFQHPAAVARRRASLSASRSLLAARGLSGLRAMPAQPASPRPAADQPDAGLPGSESALS